MKSDLFLAHIAASEATAIAGDATDITGASPLSFAGFYEVHRAAADRVCGGKNQNYNRIAIAAPQGPANSVPKGNGLY